MTSGAEYWTRICLTHSTMDPVIINKRLGKEPTRSWAAAARRKTSKGHLLDGISPNTYWSLSTKGRFENEDEAILPALAILEPAKASLAVFIESGGCAAVDISWGVDTQPGRVFGWEILGRLAELKVSLGVEVLITLDDWERGAGIKPSL